MAGPVSWLAFDRDRIALLAARMAAAADELDRVGSDDVLADAAMRTIRLAGDALRGTWLPLLGNLARCTALHGYQPAPRLDDDLAQTLVRAQSGAGWALVDDPLVDDPRRVAPGEARALGALLAHGDPRALLADVGDRDRLRHTLDAIAADPSLRRAFLAAFDDWRPLTDVLAEMHVDGTAYDIDGGELATSCAELAAALGRLLAGELPIDELCRRAATVEPYAVALTFTAAGMPGGDLARLADETLRRWLPLRRSGELVDGDGRSPGNTADLLFTGLLATPDGPPAFVATVAGRADVLWATGADTELAMAVALAGTDPRRIDVPTAGRTVSALIEWFRGADERLDLPMHLQVTGELDELRAGLGELVAPWLLQFSPLVDAWPQSAEVRRDLLAGVLADAGALAALARRGSEMVTAVAETSSKATVAQVAALVGMLLELSRLEQVHDAATRQGMWKVLVSIPTSFLPRAAEDLADRAVVPLLARDPAAVALDGDLDAHALRTVGAATVARIAFDELVAAGRIPRGTEPPPEPPTEDDCPAISFERAFQDWQQRVFGDEPSAESDYVDARRATFSGPGSAGEAMAAC